MADEAVTVKYVTVQHPVFPDVLDTVSEDRVKGFEDAGWKVLPANEVEDAPARSDLGFVNDQYGNPERPAEPTDLTPSFQAPAETPAEAPAPAGDVTPAEVPAPAGDVTPKTSTIKK